MLIEEQVFQNILKEFNLNLSGVIHIGANIGEERVFYLNHSIEKQIWVEANPVIYKILQSNVANNPWAICFNECIGDEDGKEVIFNFSNNEGQSSSIFEFGTHKQEHPQVFFTEKKKMVLKRMDTLLDENKINIKDYNFLNIDLQGADRRH